MLEIDPALSAHKVPEYFDVNANITAFFTLPKGRVFDNFTHSPGEAINDLAAGLFSLSVTVVSEKFVTSFVAGAPLLSLVELQQALSLSADGICDSFSALCERAIPQFDSVIESSHN